MMTSPRQVSNPILNDSVSGRDARTNGKLWNMERQLSSVFRIAINLTHSVLDEARRAKRHGPLMRIMQR